MKNLLTILTMVLIIATGCGNEEQLVIEELHIKETPSPAFLGEWKCVKKPFIYGSILTINEDRTFSFTYGACQMSGFSKGKWKIDNNEIILNSDSIDECLFTTDFGVYWVENITDSMTYTQPKSTIKGCEPDHAYEEYKWFYNERFKIVNDTIIHLNPKDTIEIECQDKFYKPLKEEKNSETKIEKELKNGTYTFDIAFAEWGGKSHGSTCSIIIKGDSITVINDGSLSGEKGEIIDDGILMIHKKTGKWIITHSNSDINTEEVGGCSDGPTEIDIKNKKLWLC